MLKILIPLFFGIPYLLSAQIRTGKDYAVFFYITDFKPGWTRLPETETEAKALKAELETNFGFLCELVPNPTKQQIRDNIRAYNAKLTPDDQVLFFFSMHGHYESTSDRGYLIGANGESHDIYGDTWLSYDDLRTDLSPCKAKHILLALDACHSGSFGIRSITKSKPESDLDQHEDCMTKLMKTMQYKGRQYCSSGNKDAKTPAKSLFAARFLEALRNGGDGSVLRFDDLEYWLGKVENPQPESGTFSGHNGGDFVFVRKNACNTASIRRPNDKDGDGIPDNRDKCPDIPSNTPDGCPEKISDTDEDGVPDQVDQCPEIWGYVGNSGCPLKEMVLILGGTYEMGSRSGAAAEQPVHKVTLANFFCSTSEVSVGEYLEFARGTGKNLPEWLMPASEYNITTGGNPYYAQQLPYLDNSNYPIVGISWLDAIEYCNWRSKKENFQSVYIISGQNVQANWNSNGYRLPTEAEWEFIARSRGKNTPQRETGSRQAAGNASRVIASITDGEQNELGIYHLFDNVAEWCWDWLDPEYYAKSQNSRNPLGPVSGSFKVLRGGTYLQPISLSGVSIRSGAHPSAKYNDTGFRVVRNSN